MVLSGIQFLCSDPQEALLRRFHLSDACLFLITAVFKTSNGQYILFVPAKQHICTYMCIYVYIYIYHMSDPDRVFERFSKLRSETWQASSSLSAVLSALSSKFLQSRPISSEHSSAFQLKVQMLLQSSQNTRSGLQSNIPWFGANFCLS